MKKVALIIALIVLCLIPKRIEAPDMNYARITNLIRQSKGLPPVPAEPIKQKRFKL